MVCKWRRVEHGMESWTFAMSQGFACWVTLNVCSFKTYCSNLMELIEAVVSYGMNPYTHVTKICYRYTFLGKSISIKLNMYYVCHILYTKQNQYERSYKTTQHQASSWVIIVSSDRWNAPNADTTSQTVVNENLYLVIILYVGSIVNCRKKRPI